METDKQVEEANRFIEEFFYNLKKRQELLGGEFQRILDDNLLELYEEYNEEIK